MRAKFTAKAMALPLAAMAAFPALATFHFMKVVEVFPGTAAAPNAQYVVIQMYAAGQQFVGGHAVTVYNAAGTPTATFTFPGSVANGANQARILIATPEAASFFGLSPDLVMSPSLLAGGGKVCFADTVDCVAWGAYAGSAIGVGTPFNATSGLQSGRAAIRRRDIAGSATVLDGADDTDDSANDFFTGLPAPQNNAGIIGTVPGATCGNGAIEGLEQCDDNNLVDGDGCSSTCTIEAGLAQHSVTSNAINYCQAFTPGPANTIRNRVVGAENVGTTMNVACNFHSMTNGAAGASAPTMLRVYFANNNPSGTITVSCTLLTGHQGMSGAYAVSKTTGPIAPGGVEQDSLAWTAADNPVPGATTLGSSLVGINCTLPTGAVINDTHLHWTMDNGL